MKAIDYIRKGWTQGEFARDVEGNAVDWSSDMAVCWCTEGAIFAALPLGERKEALNKVLRAIGLTSLIGWNDDPKRTKAEVEAAFEKAGI
jgi:hypothetical protein